MLDLAIDHAEKIHRDIQLDHEGVDQHQIADAHPALDDTERSAPQNQGQRHCNQRLLAGVQDVQGLLRQHRGALRIRQSLVVAACLVVFVTEILHRLEIQQRVDRARLRLALELVPAPPHGSAPVGHRHREDDVNGQTGADDRGEPDLVIPQQVSEHQRDLDQRRQDRIQSEADQRGDSANALVDLARDGAGAAIEVVAQRQRMQMAKRFQRQRARRRLRHLDEKELAQLGEERRRQPQGTVRNDQRKRHHQNPGRGLRAR